VNFKIWFALQSYRFFVKVLQKNLIISIIVSGGGGGIKILYITTLKNMKYLISFSF
jgi:hypothetical protein